MSGQLTLQLANRGRKGVVKRLPSSIVVDRDATVEDVRKAVAQKSGVRDSNRVGLFDPQTKKTIKDKAARIGDQEAVVAEGRLLVQDLGAQIGWRTTFVIEYIGPLLFHALWYHYRPSISLPVVLYSSDASPPTDVQTLLYLCFQAHFIKRELETVFLHKFSANSMPLYMIFRNSALYWLGFGICSATSIYAASSPLRYPVQARSGLGPVDYAGFALFLVSEFCNFLVHKHFASLRSRGSTARGIPNCIGSSLVTCPNYMFEVLAWVGVLVIARDSVVAISLFLGSLYMASWSRGKERSLRQQFPDQYKKKRYTFLPGIF